MLYVDDNRELSLMGIDKTASKGLAHSLSSLFYNGRKSAVSTKITILAMWV